MSSSREAGNVVHLAVDNHAPTARERALLEQLEALQGLLIAATAEATQAIAAVKAGKPAR